MRTFHKLILCLSLFSSANLYAGSELQFAEAFNILAINGAKHDQGLISQNRKLALNSGLNRIAIEYEEVFESDDGDNFDIVKSTPFLLEVYLQDKTGYRQKFAQPADADAAKKFARNPIFSLVNLNDNATIKFKLTALSGSNEAFVLQQTRLPSKKTLLITSGNSPASQKEQIHNDQTTASKMLDYWWQQATPEEREAFLKRIKQ